MKITLPLPPPKHVPYRPDLGEWCMIALVIFVHVFVFTFSTLMML